MESCNLNLLLQLTYEVPPGLRVVGLLPGSGPGHQDRVVLHAPQTCRLDEVGDAISEVGGNHHVAETFGSLGGHGGLDVLHEKEEKPNRTTEHGQKQPQSNNKPYHYKSPTFTTRRSLYRGFVHQPLYLLGLLGLRVFSEVRSL